MFLRRPFLVASLLLLAASEILAEDHFRVGVSIPLTGAFAEYGVAVRNGISLSRQDNPEAFKSIEFLIEDDRYDPKIALSNFNKSIDVDGIDLFFAWGNEPALTVAPLAEQRKVPTIVVAHHPKAAAGLKYVIRFINPAVDYSAAMLRYLRKHNLKKLGVIKSEISFFNILLEELRSGLLADESLTEYETFLPTDLDFRSSIGKLKQKQFDILGVYLVPPQVSQFYKQAAQQGFRPATFGTTTFESESVVKDSLGLMNGAVFSHISVSDEFRKKYVGQFGDDIQISYAANAYDFAALVGQLFGSPSAELSAEQILAAFAASLPQSGASGRREFKSSETSGKYFSFPIVVKQVETDKIVDLPNL